MNPILDIIICSYDRNELLVECVNSLLNQSESSQQWSVCVVNNTSTLFPEELMKRLELLQNFEVVQEIKPGLSLARNTGISRSSAPWIAFLDDDAKVPKDYISKVLEIINSGKFDCFGGHIKSWWKYGQPRWLSDTFGSKPPLSKTRSFIPEDYNWGSNIIINRNALEEAGRFPTYIGMKGNKLGYAAENIVQMKLREQGYKIGYDPDLYIEHVVMPHKLKLSWHLKAAYATGRDGREVYQDQYGFCGFAHTMKNCLSRPLKAIFFMLTKKKYYWENALLDGLKPYCVLAGKLRSLI